MRSVSDILFSLPRFAFSGQEALKPGLQRIAALLELFDHPEEAFSTALVAGSNGKGSTASILAACLSTAGKKVGLHTSPHLLRITERMRVEGKEADATWLHDRAQAHEGAFREIGASFYEATLALSLLWFAESGVSHAVVEVGLGGRLDASNILEADISVITSIDLEHTDILGDTLAAIAIEKAGIIKPGKPVVVGKMDREAFSVIEEKARSIESPLIAPAPITSNDIHLSLAGSHQLANAGVALAALKSWGVSLSAAKRKEALEHIPELSGIRARSEIARTQPLLMLDTAHNPAAIEKAMDAFVEQRKGRSQAVVAIGLLSDKDVDGIAGVLSRYDVRVLTLHTSGDRGLSAQQLATLFSQAGLPDVCAISDIKSVASLPNDCLITGSHVTVGAFLELLK